MQLLLNDQFAPITSKMGFIQCDSDLLVSEFLQWRREILELSQTRHSIRSYQIANGLENNLLSLLPLKAGSTQRFLIMPTASAWTAFLSNGFRGTDPSPVIYLPKRLETRSVYIVAIPHNYNNKVRPIKGRQGARILEIYGPENLEHLNLIRSIRLVHDVGRWTFETLGEPLPFEDQERYKKRLKKERFTFELMDQYLRELGIRVFDEDFYLPDNSQGTLVELDADYFAKARSYTLEEVRADF